MRYLTSISLALVVHVLLSIGVLMVLACTATPAPTPDVPLLDEKTVENLTIGYLLGTYDDRSSWILGRYRECFLNADDNADDINAQYIGKDIWVVEIEPPNTCTFTVHDNEARVID